MWLWRIGIRQRNAEALAGVAGVARGDGVAVVAGCTRRVEVGPTLPVESNGARAWLVAALVELAEARQLLTAVIAVARAVRPAVLADVALRGSLQVAVRSFPREEVAVVEGEANLCHASHWDVRNQIRLAGRLLILTDVVDAGTVRPTVVVGVAAVPLYRRRCTAPKLAA
ncbi:MAG: hypothetical protein COU34_04065 [Candidatus Magasanikbacteria bacterium CG10_big_fil_rev_8_21_14_0_10_43_9]|nr:MAG: hypothetical protein COU34_04065 [Candidatus Magasanikbacteria bacterium CG10_big_fil_rev_8_21_14_0_10_43_9]